MAFDEPAAEGAGEAQPAACERPDADRGFLLEIARSFAKAPKYTPESLRTDRELVLRVVREHREGWRLLRQATAELRADRELLFATVKGSVMGWRAMAFAAHELREDRELCLEAVRRNAAALELLAPALRQDRELVSEALGAIARRLQAPTPKNTSQDWDRLTSHAAIKSKSRKKYSVFDAVVLDRNEEWTERLRREVETGRCSLEAEEAGKHCRVVPLMCVRIQQPNGLILAVLGKVDSTWATSLGGKARCILPGSRILDGEQPRDTLNRFLATELAPMAKNLELDDDFQVLVEEGTSLNFGVRTRYLRSVFKATVDARFQWSKVARRLGMSHVRSPRGATQNLTLGRRFGAGASHYSAPLPPDMYVLISKESDYGFGQLPPVNRSVTIYAWIPCWEYEWLRSSDIGRATLGAWLSAVNLGTSGGSRNPGASSGTDSPGTAEEPEDSDGSLPAAISRGLPPLILPKQTPRRGMHNE